MKALKEIGYKVAIKFLLFSIFQVIYHNLTHHFLPIPQLRKILFSLSGASFGKNTVIMDVKFINLHRKGFKGFITGKNCFIGDETLVDLYNSVVLEDNVTIAQRVTVLTHTNVGYKDHPLQKYFPKNSKPVKFENGSVIGSSSTILPGITIGQESFVAAGSIVTKNVPPKTLVAGVPAKKVRSIK